MKNCFFFVLNLNWSHNSYPPFQNNGDNNWRRKNTFHHNSYHILIIILSLNLLIVLIVILIIIVILILNIISFPNCHNYSYHNYHPYSDNTSDHHTQIILPSLEFSLLTWTDRHKKRHSSKNQAAVLQTSFKCHSFIHSFVH